MMAQNRAAEASRHSQEVAKDAAQHVAQDAAQGQQALIAALLAPPGQLPDVPLREQGERAARGIEAYRANAETVAERALAAVFGTVKALVGDDDFAHLAAEFWRAAPPQRGDMGEWGDAFPAWLAAHHAMAPWPYLGGCARLDLALHRNERAADAPFDAESMNLLASTDPARLVIALLPGTELIESRWPLAAIHHAHQLPPDAADAAFEALRLRLAVVTDGSPLEAVLVVRDGWRAVARGLDAPTARWTRSLLDAAPLDRALAAAGDDFDFTTWLGNALRGAWLKGAAELGD